MRLSLGQYLIPACALLAFGAAPAQGPELPQVDGQPILAKVNGEPITLDRFLSELATLHAGMEMGGSKRQMQRPQELLDRLINTRLILQEATLIGLDRLPQVTEPVDLYRDQALAAVLLRHELQGLELDTDRVDARVRERVKELTLLSVRFTGEEVAKEFIAAVEAGGDFGDLARQMNDDGKVAGLELDDPQFIKVAKLLPQISHAASSMQVGEVSPAVEVEDSFVVFSISDVRYPDNPQVRELVEKEVWGVQRATATSEFVDSLIERHAKVDEELLESIDYEAEEPGFDKLQEDERTLVKIGDEESLTVATFTHAVKGKFFHGIEGAIESKRINSVKGEVLYDLLSKRVVLTEARRLELDKSAEYLQMIEEFRDRMLFGTFVQKVVDPDVRMDDSTMKDYLSQHADEYTSPEMMRIDGLAFGSRENAESALAKLRGGADFDWMRKNGAGRLGEDGDPLKLHGDLVVTSALPDDAREAVSGASTGEFRVCGLTEGPFYVLRVTEVVPSRPQPFEEVYKLIAPKVLSEQRTKVIEDWAAKLREVSEVEIFASGDGLLKIIGMPEAGSS